MAQPRTFLGRDQNMAGMIQVYLLKDALEIDEVTFAEIERTRVYFDDVLAITHHRAVSLSFAIVMGLAGFVLAGIGLLAYGSNGASALIPLLIASSPFLLTFVLHLILKTDFITVFGRRTLARMRFRVRKGRARRVYEELTAKIRAVQAAAAAAQKPPAPVIPELPPGPPLAGGPPSPQDARGPGSPEGGAGPGGGATGELPARS